MKRAAERLLRGLGSKPLARQLDGQARATSHVPDFGHTSGTPLDTFNRKVIIYSPARTACQSGKALTEFNRARATWKIDFDQQTSWINPLMGWTSTADPQEQLRVENGMSFFTKEQAIAYCQKYGWEYEIREPHQQRKTATVHYRNPRYMQYGDNFSVKRGGLPVGGLRSEWDTSAQEASKPAPTQDAAPKSASDSPTGKQETGKAAAPKGKSRASKKT